MSFADDTSNRVWIHRETAQLVIATEIFTQITNSKDTSGWTDIFHYPRLGFAIENEHGAIFVVCSSAKKHFIDLGEL